MFCVFKQKTAYEMRISDWSSDVCSSDLRRKAVETFVDRHVGRVLQTGFAHEIPVMDSMTEAALPYLAIVEEAREIDIALLEIDVAVGDRKSTRLNSSH